MSAALRQGGSVGRSIWSFPFRTILHWVALGCGLVLGLCGWNQARADALYRCSGSQGEAVFTSNTAGYRTCHRVGSLGGAGSLPRKLKARPMVSFEAVQSSVATTAQAIADLPKPAPSLFAAVQSAVDTTAQLPASMASGTAAKGAVPGRWEYRDSRSSPLAATDAPAAGERVLRGAVYRVVHPDGSVEYTNQPPPGQRGHAVTMLFSYIATCMACDLHSPIRWGSVRLNLMAYADIIRAASIESGVDEAFLRAIIHAESAFNPHALSLKGAQGLMQLMPGTAGDLGVLDAFDAQQNIRGGARYLGVLLHTFGGNEHLAAAAFNAGPGAVQRYNDVPPYAETQVYVERVGALRSRYGQAIHPPLATREGTGSAVQ
jgi:soluble lytic murein transglycosylase-like protein